MRLHPARAAGMIRAPWTPGWARDELWRRARATPSLDLRFADSKSLVDATTGQNLVTFTRASEATFVNSQGQIQTAAINAPRFDHNPVTGESLGLLVEEQRTNSIRNNTMVGAVAGTPGTLPTNWSQLGGTSLTREVVGVGTENGVSYIDIKFSGTTGNAFTGIQFDGSISGFTTSTAYTGSAYMRRTAGSMSNLTNPTLFIRYNLSPSGQTDISSTVSSLAGPSDSLSAQRYTVTGTTTGTLSGVAAMFVLFNHSSGVPIDITLRIGLPQLEQGAFATSVIPTAGTAATRSADVASITGSNFSSWFRGDESTVFVDCALLAGSALTTSATRTAVDITDGTASNRLAVRAILNANVTDQITVRSGGGTAINLTTGVTVSTAPRKIAAAFRVNDTAAVGTGATSVATTDTGPMPIGLNQANIGSVVALTNQNTLSGTIARLAYWPARLGNEVLQRITQ